MNIKPTLLILLYTFGLISWLNTASLAIEALQSKLSVRLLGATTGAIQNGMQPNLFYDEDTFYQGLKAVKQKRISNTAIKGAILPHHNLPSDLNAEIFAMLAKQKPDTIILLGPNHYEKGDFPVYTSGYTWASPFGLVYPQLEIIKQITSQNLAQVNEQILTNEHSIGYNIPFMKYFVPNAKVVPLILNPRMNSHEIELLASVLTERIKQHPSTVILASVDFSHYLPKTQADEKDQTTLRLMKEMESNKILQLGSEHLDSPESISLLLEVMKKLKTTKVEVLGHKNSSELMPNTETKTTSYFSIIFH